MQAADTVERSLWNPNDRKRTEPGDNYDSGILAREPMSATKVIKAHAVPQGLCGILINAPKLLANQQEYGHGLIRNIVTRTSVRGGGGASRMG